jgi:Protein of unknown function (DUF2478)
MFDAQCDFAAVVYGLTDDPDGLLLDFAEDLRRAGFRTAGLVQLGGSGPCDHNELRTVVLSNAEVLGVAHDPASSTLGCRLDSRRLAGIASMIEAAIAAGADLVIINRFGKLEAEGEGLISLIKQAGDADIPVLIAVPEHRFAAWIRYSEGMSVRLACHRGALDLWWQSVTQGAARRHAGATFCAFAK